MSVLDDIMKKSNPLSNPVTSQSVATQAAPKPAEQVAQGGVPTAAPAVNNSAAVTQMPKTGFNAEAAKVAQNVVNNMNSQGVTPAVTPAPVNTPAEQQPQQQKPMSYVDMLNAFYTPETAEEKAKRERKEKWDKTAAAIGDGISALANLYYTTKGAPNSYDGKNSMSERTRQLYDKLDKDRKENERWYLNHYMNAAKMDEDAKRNAANDQFRREGREHDWKRQDELDKQNKDNTAWSHQFQEEGREYNRKHQAGREAVQDARADKQLELQEKQQQISNSHFWASHNLAVKNYDRQMEKENPTVGFALGNGRKANIKKQDINPQNVSYVYNKLMKLLPDDVKKQYTQEQVYDSKGKPATSWITDESGKRVQVPIMKARKLDDKQMMVIIGEHIANYPEVQNAWKEIGGEITVPNKDGSTRPNSVQQNGQSSSQHGGGNTRPWAQQTGQTRPWATGK